MASYLAHKQRPRLPSKDLYENRTDADQAANSQCEPLPDLVCQVPRCKGPKTASDRCCSVERNLPTGAHYVLAFEIVSEVFLEGGDCDDAVRELQIGVRSTLRGSLFALTSVSIPQLIPARPIKEDQRIAALYWEAICHVVLGSSSSSDTSLIVAASTSTTFFTVRSSDLYVLSAMFPVREVMLLEKSC